MRNLLAVGIGSFTGGIARYLIGGWAQALANSRFPFGTLVVNLSGCFVIGLIGGAIERGSPLSESWRLFLVTGFLGGFTTFSAFSYESVGLVRTGGSGLAAGNVIVSVVLGLSSTWLGLKVAHSM